MPFFGSSWNDPEPDYGPRYADAIKQVLKDHPELIQQIAAKLAGKVNRSDLHFMLSPVDSKYEEYNSKEARLKEAIDKYPKK